MDPMTGALLMAASFATSLISNRVQAKTQQAQIKAQTEQTRLQAAEATLERTKQYRKNLSTNLALSGVGVGGVSGFRGISSENTADYLADVGALGRQQQIAVITGSANRALSKANKLAGDVNAITNAAKMASELGLFAAGGK
jgi:hypothetical protein